MVDDARSLDDITGTVVHAAYKLHRGLGPGLLESVYKMVLARDLARSELSVAKEVDVSFDYDGLHFEKCLRVDLLVHSRVIVEIKSAENSHPSHPKQLLTYLRLMKLPVGLLINFGAPTLKEGLRRVVNDLPSAASPRLRVNKTAEDRRPPTAKN